MTPTSFNSLGCAFTAPRNHCNFSFLIPKLESFSQMSIAVNYSSFHLSEDLFVFEITCQIWWNGQRRTRIVFLIIIFCRQRALTYNSPFIIIANGTTPWMRNIATILYKFPTIIELIVSQAGFPSHMYNNWQCSYNNMTSSCNAILCHNYNRCGIRTTLSIISHFHSLCSCSWQHDFPFSSIGL